MTIRDLKNLPSEYDDLPLCYGNHVGFPIEVTEIRKTDGAYLERSIDHSKTVNSSFILLE